MSRGSISSWQDYGRRNSFEYKPCSGGQFLNVSSALQVSSFIRSQTPAYPTGHSLHPEASASNNSEIMPQFSGGPVEFMMSDGIECKRGDGWFLSYTKIAAIIIVFIIGVIAAGFLGWYINSIPKRKPYDDIDLLSDEIEETDNIGEALISPYIHPLKYRLRLTPIIDVNGLSSLKGHVIIDFHVNVTSLSKLSLSAKNITVTSYKLLLLESEENKTQLKRRRKRRTNDEINYHSHQNDATIENDIASRLTENETVPYEQNGGYPSENMSSVGVFKLPSTDKLEPSNVSDINKFAVTPIPELSEFNTSEVETTQYEIDNDKEIHTVYLKTKVQQGIYSLEIDYHLLIDDNAFFIANFSDPGTEKWLMGTKLKHLGARYLLPVFDDTGIKSVFSVSVARSKEMRVLSNMPLRTSRDTENSSVIIDTFDESPPFSPHNLAFLMGHIEPLSVTFVADSNVTATFWCDSNTHSQGIYLFDKLDAAVINLIDVFSMAYPLPKLDLVALPSGIDESIGSPGLIAIKQSLFYTNTESPLVTKYNALKVLITLLSQQWLDELVNVNHTDAWIFESLFLYLQHEVIQKIDSSLDTSNSFIADVQLQVMEIDGYSISGPFHENANYRLLRFLNDEYAKGACLIRMLHGTISDTAFRNGYKKLFTRWKYNATDVIDFVNVVAEEIGSASETSLEEAMNTWISQGGYPLVTVMRNYEEESAIIYQEQFTFDKPLEDFSKQWHIPLNYIDENGNWSSPTKIWFEPDKQKERKMVLANISSNESWVIFNINKTGYYRVHYDERNWMLLKTALENNHEEFPVETRASLVDDVFSLAAVGLLKYEFAFDFIKYMQMKERHYLPWSALMRHVIKLYTLLYETSAFTDFQEFMVKFVSPLYSKVGLNLKEGSQLITIAVRMACMFEHPECLDWAKNIFENAKTDDEIQQAVPSYIRETFYCTIARYGNRKEWNYFTEKAMSIEDKEERNRLLSSFACFQAPWILQSILNEIVHETRFPQDEISVILKAFPRNPAAAQAASRFVRANWQEIAQRFLGSYSVLKSFVLSMVNGLSTEQDLEDLQIFRETNYDSMKGTRYAAALVEANGNFVTSWLKNSLPEIEKLLKEDAVDKVLDS